MWPNPHKKKVERFRADSRETDALYAKYCELVAANKTCVMHLRGHGQGDPVNIQPFTAWNDRIGYTLNGSIYNAANNPDTGVLDPAMLDLLQNRHPSDAAAFGVGVLDTVKKKDFNDPAWRRLAKIAAGYNNLMSFMDYKGNLWRVGRFETHEGKRFSQRPPIIFYPRQVVGQYAAY